VHHTLGKTGLAANRGKARWGETEAEGNKICRITISKKDNACVFMQS